MTEHVMIVDDDPDLRSLLEYTFEDRGFEVTAFDGGASALAHLTEGGRPDCIVLDLMMPGVDGLEMLERLDDEELAAIPVVLLTGRDDEETVETAFARGADECLLKPFGADELVARVRELLG